MKPDCRVHGVYHYATADDKDVKKSFFWHLNTGGGGPRVFFITPWDPQGAWGATKNTQAPKHMTYKNVFSNIFIHEILFLLRG